MTTGTAVGQDAELRRLREDLYRPSPSPGAVERYTALLADRSDEGADDRPDLVESSRPPRSLHGRRRRIVPAAVAAAVLAVSLVAAAVLQPGERDPGAAEPLVADGPYAVSDQQALDSLSDRTGPDSRLVVRAVRGSELAQLDVWDTREPEVWVQQGAGPITRRFEGSRPPAERSRPFSIVVQCPAPARYRWTIIGTTPEHGSVHVLETAAADCGPTPTVATFTRPRGAAVTGFDLAVPAGVRWGMAFVHPISDV